VRRPQSGEAWQNLKKRIDESQMTTKIHWVARIKVDEKTK